MLHTIWSVFIAALGKFTQDDGFPLAGNIAFSVVLSAFPFLIFLTTLAGFLGNEALAKDVVVYLLSILPRNLVDPIASEIHSILTVPRSDLLSLSVFLTLWTASSSVHSVRAGLNRAYGLQETRNFFVLILTNFAFVLAGSAMLLSLAMLIIIGPIIWDITTQWVPIIHDFTNWFNWLRFPVVLMLMIVSLIAAHQILPARRQALKAIVPGILFTLVMWLAISLAYAEFLSRFADYATTYVGLAGIIIALMFIYLSGAALIFGGEINQAYFIHKKPDRIP